MTDTAKEYAEALFALAGEQGKEKEFLSALRLIESELEKAPEYLEILASPDIPAKERIKAVSDAFKESIPEDVMSLLSVMIEKGCIKSIKGCIFEYGELYRESSNIASAKVISAVELSDRQKQALKEKLEKISGKRVEISYETDKSIIGGLTVFIGGNVIDGSLRHDIKEVKEELYR